MARCVPGREQAPPAQQTGGLRRSELQVLQAFMQGGQPLLSPLLVLGALADGCARHPAAGGVDSQDEAALHGGLGRGGRRGHRCSISCWQVAAQRLPHTMHQQEQQRQHGITILSTAAARGARPAAGRKQGVCPLACGTAKPANWLASYMSRLMMTTGLPMACPGSSLPSAACYGMWGAGCGVCVCGVFGGGGWGSGDGGPPGQAASPAATVWGANALQNMPCTAPPKLHSLVAP